MSGARCSRYIPWRTDRRRLLSPALPLCCLIHCIQAPQERAFHRVGELEVKVTCSHVCVPVGKEIALGY